MDCHQKIPSQRHMKMFGMQYTGLKMNIEGHLRGGLRLILCPCDVIRTLAANQKPDIAKDQKIPFFILISIRRSLFSPPELIFQSSDNCLFVLWGSGGGSPPPTLHSLLHRELMFQSSDHRIISSVVVSVCFRGSGGGAVPPREKSACNKSLSFGGLGGAAPPTQTPARNKSRTFGGDGVGGREALANLSTNHTTVFVYRGGVLRLLKDMSPSLLLVLYPSMIPSCVP